MEYVAGGLSTENRLDRGDNVSEIIPNPERIEPKSILEKR